MTNHRGAQPSEGDANPAVIIKLPNGSTEKIAVGNKYATVRNLKVGCELQFGIPCHLQQVSALENPGVELSDWSPLRDVVQTIDDVIVVQVPVWWNKFICVSLNNEIDNVCRRAKLPMQQISKEERLFVGYFIACCRGHEHLLDRLRALDIQLDQHAATEAGRNLFHAAAASGKVNCVEFVAKYLIKPSKEILTMLDTNRETPIDIARRLNHHDTERLLYKYMYHEKGDREERSSAESGIDVSEECGSVDSDDSSEESRITENGKTAPEGTWEVHEKNNTEVKNTAFEELVITECASDEGLSFAIDLKLAQQGTPPNPLKSEVGVIQRDGLSPVDKPDVNNSHRKEREASPCSSDSSDESSSLSPRLDRPQTLNLAPNQHLLRRRFVRPKSARTVRYPQFSVSLEDEEVDGNDNHLPPLESQMLVNKTSGNLLSSSASIGQMRKLKQAIARTNSTPNSPTSNQKLSPTPHDDKLVTKSAPGSPQNTRMVFKPSVKPPQSLSGSVSSVPPNISSRMLDRRRGSEPIACLSRTNGVRPSRPRRDAVITADLPHGDNYIGSPIMHKRGKARYVLGCLSSSLFSKF